MFVPPRPVEVVRQPMEIKRRGPSALEARSRDQTRYARTAPARSTPKENPLADRRVVSGRQEPVIPLAGGPEPLRPPELKRPNPDDLRPEAMPLPKVRARRTATRRIAWPPATRPNRAGGTYRAKRGCETRARP